MTIPASRGSGPTPVPERHARLSCAVAPSRILSVVFAVALLQGLLIAWVCGAPRPFALAITLLVLLYAAMELRRLRSGAGVISTRARRWFWRPQEGEEREFLLRGELVLWPWLVVVNGRDLRGRRLRLVLARDSVHPADWRRLQAALRYMQ